MNSDAYVLLVLALQPSKPDMTTGTGDSSPDEYLLHILGYIYRLNVLLI